MNALVFDIRISSLYSIRIPFTWQSALTYPVLPPSAVIGLLANALQRHKNDKHPLKYLDQIEKNVIWAGSRLLTPCVIKSYMTSAIVKWEDTLGGKFTNALGRQFAFTRDIEIVAIFKEDTLLEDVITALKTTPLTCGDSESALTVTEVSSKEIEKGSVEINEEVEISFPFPFSFDKMEILAGGGKIYMVHERCLKKTKNFPLIMYLFPIEDRDGIIYPTAAKIRIKESQGLYKLYTKDFSVIVKQ